MEVVDVGRMRYRDALRLQEDRVKARRADEVPDTLFIVEHPHVLTMGSSTDPAHLLVGEAELEARGIDLHAVGRGGDVTYHGPGQLVAYPILDLKPDRKDLHKYLRDLEEVLMRLAASFEVDATRSDNGTGVWTPRGKLAAIGVRVSSGWITSHGLALNVETDLSFFDTIVPCGIHDRGVTSLAEELGEAPDRLVVRDRLVEHFCDVFGREIPVAPPTTS